MLIRVVLDTNVLVSATLVSNGIEFRLVKLWQQGAFDRVFSPAALAEFIRVLSYPKFLKRRWMTRAEIEALAQSFAEQSVFVSGEVQACRSRDPDDNKFLAAAAEARAQFLITGDRDLLVLQSEGETKILTPRVFLDWWNSDRERSP